MVIELEGGDAITTVTNEKGEYRCDADNNGPGVTTGVTEIQA